MPSPMAINPPSPTPSMFNKKSNNSLPPMTSATSYLSAISRRAKSQGSTPTSTPALSMSSSLTGSSEDTILDEGDWKDDGSGLYRPRNPPTSEQVYTTVHTEFGHCSNEEYRFSSQHDPSQPIMPHVDFDPPYYILLTWVNSWCYFRTMELMICGVARI